MSRPTDFLDAALHYASLGWPVFPLAPRSKHPLIPVRDGGRGLHDATTDPALIRQWWTDFPTANIGLRTGVAFDVLDLDGPEASSALAHARSGREGVHGPVVRTGKGLHVFVLPTGLGNRAGVLPGVDFRGADSYVVAPPSMHPDGHTYTWVSGDPAALAPAPSWLVELLHPRRDLPVTAPLVPVTPSRATAYGSAALRRELERLAVTEVGTRSDSLNQAAFSLGQLVAAGALNEDETAAALLDAGPEPGSTAPLSHFES
jgi:hypothetical protein